MFDGGDKIAVVLVWKVPILFKKLCLWLQGTYLRKLFVQLVQMCYYYL